MSLDDRMQRAAARMEGATMNMEVPENDVARRARVRTVTRASAGVIALVVVTLVAVSAIGIGAHDKPDVANGKARAASEFQSLLAKRAKASASVTFLDRFTGSPDRTRTLSQNGKGDWSQKLADGSSSFYNSRKDQFVACAPQPQPEPICAVDTSNRDGALKDVFTGKTLKQWTDAIAHGDASLRFSNDTVAGHAVLCASRTDGPTRLKTCLDDRTGVVLAGYETDTQGNHDSVATSVRDAQPSDFVPSAVPLHITDASGGALSFSPAELQAVTGRNEITVAFVAPGHTFRFTDPALHFTELAGNAAGAVQKANVFFPKAGDYEFVCTIPGHAQAGEKGVIHVPGPDAYPRTAG